MKINLLYCETSLPALEAAAFRKQLSPIWFVLQKVCDVHLNSCSDLGGAFGGFSSSVERNALAHNY